MTGALGLTATEVAVPPPLSSSGKEKNEGNLHSFDQNAEPSSTAGREDKRKELSDHKDVDGCAELTVALRIELLKVSHIILTLK